MFKFTHSKFVQFSQGMVYMLSAAGLLLAAAPVSAQDTAKAAEEPIEEVVVTGIRRGIRDAIEVKRQSGSIVEAISAEDIGKLPDTSIADSISRLPGLTSQRAEGRASAISLRGTDPGFTTALLNGREQVSTGDNRSIEFDQYPSELLSSVVVYKTPDAQLVGQGLAGTIDMRTTRPLEYGRRAIVFNIRGERNGNNDLGADSKENGYRASFSYIDQFADDTFGVTFGVARLDSPLATRGAGTYEPWHPNGTPGTNVNPGVGPGVFVTDGIKVRTDMGKNVRTGAMTALEWRPSESFTGILDAYYTKRDQENNARSLEINLGGYPAPCCDGTFPANTIFGYSNTTVVDNTVVAATLNQRVPLARNFLFMTKDEIKAAGLNGKWKTGAWTVTGDLSYSKATRDERQYETNAQYFPNLAAPTGTPRNVYDTGLFSISADNMPQLSFTRDYANATNIRVGPTIYGAGYSKIPHIEDELKSVRVDVEREMENWLSSVSAGINYSDRTKDKLQPEGGLNTLNNAFGNYHQIGSQYLLAPTNLSYAGAGNALAWDVLGALSAYYQPIVYGSPTTPGFDYLIGKNWNVEEKVTTGYIRGNLNHEISDNVTLKGNLGVQIIQTDQSSSAIARANGLNFNFTSGKKFTDVLPAFNLAFVLPSQQTVRVGLAREIARARMDQLKASSEQGVSNFGIPGGSGGNPKLDPWRADAFDLSYEKYFEKNAYFSAAVFYKKLKSYIYNQTDLSHDFSDFISTLPSCFPGPTPNCIPNIRTTGSFSGPVNGQGGTLKGAELSLSLPGSMLSQSLDGFGAILSVGLTDSNITIQDPPGNNFITGNGLGAISLPGLSKTVWNATLYYERSGFSARVATRSRSKFIGEVTNFANDRNFKFVQATQLTDLQLGYSFDDASRFKGVSLLLQVNNVSNEPYIAYAITETRQQDYQEYGRQILLGVNYKIQ